MLFAIILPILLILFLAILFKFYQGQKNEFRQEKINLTKKYNELKENDKRLSEKVKDFEKKTSVLFTFYDIARSISPLFQKEKIINTFLNQLAALDDVEAVSLSGLEGPDAHSFPINEKEGDLFIRTHSFSILHLGPIFAKLLAVCLAKSKLYSRLQELSIHDYLTGAYNRRYFDQRLEEEFLRAKNLKQKLSFLMLDIDNFKAINDTYGHIVGDVALKRCTQLIAENIREIDFVGRIGGEEFGVLLLDTDKAGAIMVSERICSRISQEKIKAFDETLGFTVSIGVSTYPVNTVYLDLLAEIADKALLRAKASGKDRVCWF